MTDVGQTTVTGLESNTEYSFQVQAKNRNSTGEMSDFFSRATRKKFASHVCYHTDVFVEQFQQRTLFCGCLYALEQGYSNNFSKGPDTEKENTLGLVQKGLHRNSGQV